MHHRLATTFAASIALPAVAFAQFAPEVAHWQLDETSGVTAMDMSPLGNHGTLTNFTGTPWVPGQLGNGLQFDGVDDYVLIQPATGLPIYDALGTPFSIAFWIKAPAQSDRRVYSEQAAAPTTSGPLFTLGSGSGTAVNATAKLRVFLRTDEVINTVNVLSNGIVFDDSWHHVAYTDVSGRAEVWIDGVLDTRIAYAEWAFGPRSSLRGSYAQLNSVTLGAVVRNLTVATPLTGILDDLRVYRTSLGAGDIAAIMVGAQPSFCTASIGEYGYGCGNGPLDLAATGSAAFGNTIYVQLLRCEPGALALLGVGCGVVHPIDLSGFGLVGCTLYPQNMDTLVIGAFGPAGSTTPLGFTVPNHPGLACVPFTLQGLALTSTGIETSPAAIAQLGY